MITTIILTATTIIIVTVILLIMIIRVTHGMIIIIEMLPKLNALYFRFRLGTTQPVGGVATAFVAPGLD